MKRIATSLLIMMAVVNICLAGVLVSQWQEPGLKKHSSLETYKGKLVKYRKVLTHAHSPQEAKKAHDALFSYVALHPELNAYKMDKSCHKNKTCLKEVNSYLKKIDAFYKQNNSLTFE